MSFIHPFAHFRQPFHAIVMSLPFALVPNQRSRCIFAHIDFLITVALFILFHSRHIHKLNIKLKESVEGFSRFPAGNLQHLESHCSRLCVPLWNPASLSTLGSSKQVISNLFGRRIGNSFDSPFLPIDRHLSFENLSGYHESTSAPFITCKVVGFPFYFCRRKTSSMEEL